MYADTCYGAQDQELNDINDPRADTCYGAQDQELNDINDPRLQGWDAKVR